jgi:hypothetical protein
MNFNDLFRKISELDKGTVNQKTSLNESIIECGGPMPMGMAGMSSPQQQQDSISANVSMNAQGPGGIRDLMAILKNIEQGGAEDMPPEGDAMITVGGNALGADELGAELDQAEHPHSEHPGHGDEEEEELFGDMEEEFANSPDEMYAGVDAVTGSGNDLNRAKTMHHRASPGDNPMAMESLISDLSALYNEVKLREGR